RATEAEKASIFSRFFGFIKSIFASSETVAPEKVEPVKTEQREQRRPQRNSRQRDDRQPRRDRNGSDRDNRNDRGNRNERPDRGDNDNRRRRNQESRNPRAAQTEENAVNINEQDRNNERRKPREEQSRGNRPERQPRRRSDDKRQAENAVQTESLNPVNTMPELDEDKQQQVTQRRQRRQLRRKVRITDVHAETDATISPVAEPTTLQIADTANATTDTAVSESRQTHTPVVEATNSNVNDAESTTGENQDRNFDGHRRSRRSPRHLRVSGQRRRRYRDDRRNTTSPVPLEMAMFSPELASGKVWVQYPVQQPERNADAATQHTEAAAFVPNEVLLESQAAQTLSVAVAQTSAPIVDTVTAPATTETFAEKDRQNHLTATSTPAQAETVSAVATKPAACIDDYQSSSSRAHSAVASASVVTASTEAALPRSVLV
ncbi:MAG: hypothetical protein ACRCYD_03915, partial [Plesiomonas sp.]